MAYTRKIGKGYNADFPQHLRLLMEEKKTTQKELANYLGVSPQAVGAYCRGETIPSIEYAGKIADYFGVSMDFMAGRIEVRTIDAFTQYACKEIGLTENAIELLKEWNNSKPEKIKLLCKLICSLESQEKHCITSEQGTVARSLIDSMDAEQWRTLFKLYLEVMHPKTQLDDK